MGMTKVQLQLIQAIANGNYKRAKELAIICCNEDKTQKNEKMVKSCLEKLTEEVVELPFNISNFTTMDTLRDYRPDRYYLTREEKSVLDHIVKMDKVTSDLNGIGIPYLNATLLYGESGVGKTALSKHIAYHLGLPYLYVNLSKMLDSYLGGTAKNLTALFQFVSTMKCVLMLDEIDALATNRKYSDSSAGAEVSRSTTCLLQLLDQAPNELVVIAATNLPEVVDPAIMRRFQKKHEVKRMGKEDGRLFIDQFLEDCGLSYEVESADQYLEENMKQSDIMSHLVESIADMFAEHGTRVIL